ncbi:MAG: choice-of-anchor Q domain-containing protein, partial [Bacteroidota bacterium]
EFLSTQTWVNDKPYLIIDNVILDSLETLTLEPGVRIYLHRDAVFAIGGTLIANGEKDMPVTFQGDRLEKFYEDIPGQWGGIYLFAGTKDNKLNYTIIKGANFGIIVDTSMNENPTLELSNSEIGHISSVGLLGRGAKIHAVNNVFYNCGSSAVALTIGGSYEFYHCTIANNWGTNGFSSKVRTDPAVYLNNYYLYTDTLSTGAIVTKPEIRDIEKAYFGNCIIWGNQENELYIDKFPDIGELNYKFENCIGKFAQEGYEFSYTDFPNLINKDPKFISRNNYDFRPDTLSPAIDAGAEAIGNLYPVDKNGNSRIEDVKPDIGAYEYIYTEEKEQD